MSSNFSLSNLETSTYIRHLTFNSEMYFWFIGHNSDNEGEHGVSGPRIVGGRNASATELPYQVSHKNDMVLLQ